MSSRYDFKTVISFDTLRRIRSLAVRENAISHPEGRRAMFGHTGEAHVAIESMYVLYLIAEAQGGRRSMQRVDPDKVALLPDGLLPALKRHALKSDEPKCLVPSAMLLALALECIARRSVPKPKASIRPGVRT